jgi:hypothetical protein
MRGQVQDGGWSYGQGGKSSGSMTSAGLASVSICLTRLTTDDRQPTGDEKEAIERGMEWMTSHFAVRHNPQGNTWLLYYLLMLRRAADATGTERFGDHDWSHEVADYLTQNQNRMTGSWRGIGHFEDEPLVATSFAVLSLVGVEPAPAQKK